MSHVLDKFKFCPVCGSQHFEINNFKSKKCKDCGFTYYLNPSSATVAFILNEKEELLVVRRKTGEEGVAREVKEETGLEVIGVNYQFSIPNLYLYSDFLVHTLDMFYVVKVKDLSHVEAMDDAEESYWIPLSNLHPEEFGLGSIRQGVAKFLAKHKTKE